MAIRLLDSERANHLVGVNLLSRTGAVIVMASAALFWSTGGVLVKWIELGPMAIAGWRSLITGVTLWLLMGRPRLAVNKTSLGVALVYSGMVISFVVATKWTTAANAIMLQFTCPVYVAILAPRILNEPTQWWDWLTIIVGLSGMSLFFLDQLSPQGLLGNLLAVGCGMLTAILFILMRKTSAKPSHGAIMGNGLTALICLPFMFQTMPTAEGWLGLTLLGVFQLGVGYYLFTRAIQHVTAVESLLICMVEPVLNPVWVFLLIGEIPQSFALVGGLLVLAAATFRGILAARVGISGQ